MKLKFEIEKRKLKLKIEIKKKPSRQPCLGLGLWVDQKTEIGN